MKKTTTDSWAAARLAHAAGRGTERLAEAALERLAATSRREALANAEAVAAARLARIESRPETSPQTKACLDCPTDQASQAA